jgi:lipid-binding SYLF domain-containing protein
MVWGIALGTLLALGQPALAQKGDSKAAADRQAESSKAAETRQRIDANAQETLKDLFEQNEGAKKLYDKAAGYAVFSGTKAGFVVSGAGGTGVAVNKRTGQRTYMKMGSAGVGLSFGARRYDLVILFETPEHLANFEQGGWDSSATAEATAGTESKGVGSTFFDGIAIFRMTNRGLMANADVSGTRFWVAEDLNVAE